MLQNSRVAAFTVFELLKEKQVGGSNYPPPSSTQIRVKPPINAQINLIDNVDDKIQSRFDTFLSDQINLIKFCKHRTCSISLN